MPIYEYFCPGCHTVYNFFSSSAACNRLVPNCPSGNDSHRLEKRPSKFATVRPTSGRMEEAGDFGHLDEERLGAAFETMANEMERVAESDDPRSVARALERFSELSGMELGPAMREALSRLEQGEDVEAIEAELESSDHEAAPELSDFFTLERLARRRRGPRIDPELYFFDS